METPAKYLHQPGFRSKMWDFQARIEEIKKKQEAI